MKSVLNLLKTISKIILRLKKLLINLDILDPPKHGEVGLCVPLSEDGNAIYLLGVIVDDFSKVEENMLTV